MLFRPHDDPQSATIFSNENVCLIYFVLQIIDPFVEVEIIGLPVDCSKEQTRVVDDNGKLSQATFRGILLSFKHI